MVSFENFKPRLRELLHRSDAPDLVSNTVWVLSIATALPQRYLKPVDILEPLLYLLSEAVRQVKLFVITIHCLVSAEHQIGSSIARTAVLRCHAGITCSVTNKECLLKTKWKSSGQEMYALETCWSGILKVCLLQFVGWQL